MTREAYDQVMNAHHKSHLSHELIAAAAGWQAMKAWNEHKERQGQAVDHAKMKEFMAAASAAFIDHMIETKGLDAIDRHRARQEAEVHYAQYPQYGQYPQYPQNPQYAPYGQYEPYGREHHHEHHFGHHHHHHHR